MDSCVGPLWGGLWDLKDPGQSLDPLLSLGKERPGAAEHFLLAQMCHLCPDVRLFLYIKLTLVFITRLGSALCVTEVFPELLPAWGRADSLETSQVDIWLSCASKSRSCP